MADSLEQILAERIRAIADERGLPISHLADRSGMARSYVWRLLAAKSSATLDAVQRIAAVLGTEPLDLLRRPASAAARARPVLFAERVVSRPDSRRRRPTTAR